jgi:hypothetical protein
LLEFAVLEQADDAVFAVVACLADHLTATNVVELSMEWAFLLDTLPHVTYMLPTPAARRPASDRENYRCL